MHERDHAIETSQAAGDVSVVLAPALCALFPSAPQRLRLCADTVDEMITALDARWPGMGDRLRDSSPSVRRHIAIYCDGQRATLNTPLRPGTAIFVLTAISGG